MTPYSKKGGSNPFSEGIGGLDPKDLPPGTDWKSGKYPIPSGENPEEKGPVDGEAQKSAFRYAYLPGILSSNPENQEATVINLTDIYVQFPGVEVKNSAQHQYLLPNTEQAFTGDLEVKIALINPETGAREDCVEDCNKLDLTIRVIQCGVISEEVLKTKFPSLHDPEYHIRKFWQGIFDGSVGFEMCTQALYKDFKVGPDRRIHFANFPLPVDGMYQVEFLPLTQLERASYEPLALNQPEHFNGDWGKWRKNIDNYSNGINLRILPQLKAGPMIKFIPK